MSTGSQLNCKLLTKPRAVLNHYLICHVSVFFFCLYFSYKLEMEHLLNIVLAVTLKRPTLGFPLFLTLSIARMKVNLGVKLTFSSVPTSLVTNCNCLAPLRSIFSYVKWELQEFLCWRLFWRWTYKCWQVAFQCLNTSNALHEWVVPMTFEAQINIQILFWLTYVFWPCPFLNFTCVCLRTAKINRFPNHRLFPTMWA